MTLYEINEEEVL